MFLRKSFFKVPAINSLKLRGGWGKTGNQEFPAGASQRKYVFQSGGGQQQVTNANADLKWQSDRQYNVGLDVAVLKIELQLLLIISINSLQIYYFLPSPYPPHLQEPEQLPGEIYPWKHRKQRI